MRKLNFSEKVKTIIKKRAGYRCSFPDCNKLLVGPSSSSEDFIELGECAHIYGASPKGPRYTAELSEKSIKSVDNCIFLCKDHHTLIDDKENEASYPPPTLLLFKAKHEQEISKELGLLHYPLQWIKSIKILKSPVLREGKIYSFSKANILYGNNSSGKSVILEYIYAFLTGVCKKRMKKGFIQFEVEFANLIYPVVICEITEGDVRYRINDVQLQGCPFAIQSLIISDDFHKTSCKEPTDPIDEMMQITGLTRAELNAIIDNYKNENPLKVVKIEHDFSDCDSSVIDFLKITRKEDGDFSFPYYSLGDREKNLVVWDLLISYLSEQSRYRNIILLVDWARLHVFDKKDIQQLFNTL